MFTPEQMEQVRQVVREEVAAALVRQQEKVVTDDLRGIAAAIEEALAKLICDKGFDPGTKDCPNFFASSQLIRKLGLEVSPGNVVNARFVRFLARRGVFHLPIQSEPYIAEGHSRAGVLIRFQRLKAPFTVRGQTAVPNPFYHPEILG